MHQFIYLCISCSMCFSGQWTEPEPKVYIFASKGLTPSSKIAGFDMDSTLIIPKSGAKWPKGKGIVVIIT